MDDNLYHQTDNSNNLINENSERVLDAPTSETSLTLKNGLKLIFKPEKEMTWGDFSKYQDLGSGIKGTVDGDTNRMEMDLSNVAKGTRAQKEFLVKFYWDAYHVNLNDVTLNEMKVLLAAIQGINPLAGMAEVLKG